MSEKNHIGWYHNYNEIDGEDLFYHDKNEDVVTSVGVSGLGPFETFTECRKDAIESVRCDLQRLHSQMRCLRSLKRADVKPTIPKK